MFGCLRGLLKGPKIYKKNTKKNAAVNYNSNKMPHCISRNQTCNAAKSQPTKQMDGWMDGGATTTK